MVLIDVSTKSYESAIDSYSLFKFDMFYMTKEE